MYTVNIAIGRETQLQAEKHIVGIEERKKNTQRLRLLYVSFTNVINSCIMYECGVLFSGEFSMGCSYGRNS